jgi:tetratricopeptide (TPR) repeat protein
MFRSRKFFFGVISVVLIAAAFFGIDQYRTERQFQGEAALALLVTGLEQFEQKQYEASLETLRSIPEGRIEDWRLPYYQGASLIQLKNYAAAVVLLEKALAMNNGEEGIPFALGVAYFKLGNLRLSKGYFHSVLEINPANEEAKGLMDIMANLERIQTGELVPEPREENTGMPRIHSQPPAEPPSSEAENGQGT